MQIEMSTPYDIDQIPVDSVAELLKDEVTPKYPHEVRLNLVKLIHKILGLTVSSDIALAMSSAVAHRQIVAIAGSGKSTFLHLDIIKEKIMYSLEKGEPLYGNNVLVVVFNDSNVNPLLARHRALVNKIKMANIKGFYLDANLDVMTLHSFGRKWMLEYAVQCDVVDARLAHEAECRRIMQESMDFIEKRRNMKFTISPLELMKVYQHTRQKLIEFDDPRVLEKFPNLNLEPEVIRDLMKFYDALKKRKKVYEFTDMLYKVYQLMRTNEQARQRISAYYKYVGVDEAQDFTPLMSGIIRLMSDNKVLIKVGDEDQCIYDFNGAEVTSMLKFNSDYPEGKIFTLNQNRRCGSNILDAARVIIEHNTQRFNKKLIAVRPDGQVHFEPYSTEEGQILSLVKSLRNMDPKDLNDVGICYRNQDMATLLTDTLNENGIPFNILSGVTAYGHELYTHVTDVLSALYSPMDRYAALDLWKALPITRNDYFDLIGYDWKYRKFIRNDESVTHFKDVDYGVYFDRKGFVEELKKLAAISPMVSSVPLEKYFPVVYGMILKYFWEWELKKREERGDDISMEREYIQKVYNFFNSPLTYDEIFKKLSDERARLRRNNEIEAGVTLGTMHSFKGLEFKHFHILFLDDSRFPSLDIATRNSGDSVTEDSMESETRLMYVAATRAKDHVYYHYRQDNPSLFVKWLLTYYNEKTVAQQEEAAGSVTETSSFLDPGSVMVSRRSNSGFMSSVFDKL